MSARGKSRLLDQLAAMRRELNTLKSEVAGIPFGARLPAHRQWALPLGVAVDVGTGPVGVKPHSSGDEVVWRGTPAQAFTGFLPGSDGTRKVGGDWGGGTSGGTENYGVMNLDGEVPTGTRVVWLIHWQLAFFALDGTVPAGTVIQVKPRIFKPNPLHTISSIETAYIRRLVVARDTTSGNRIGGLGGTFIQSFTTSAEPRDVSGGSGSGLPPGVGLYLGAAPSQFLSLAPNGAGPGEGVLTAQQLDPI